MLAATDQQVTVGLNATELTGLECPCNVENSLPEGFPDLPQRRVQNTPGSGELTMAASTTLDYRFPKYVKTGASARLSSTQVNKIINYIRNSRQ